MAHTREQIKAIKAKRAKTLTKNTILATKIADGSVDNAIEIADKLSKDQSFAVIMQLKGRLQSARNT